jgi:hypothetical protein
VGLSKPNFQSVVDLGLRDVGVRNDPRRLAAYFAKISVALFTLVALSVAAMCAIVIETEAGPWPSPRSAWPRLPACAS